MKKKILLIAGCLFATITMADPANTLSSTTDPTKNNSPDKIHAVIIAEEVATLSSPMMGYLQKLAIKEGNLFKKDDLLAEFECKIQKAELQKANAQVKLTAINKDSYERLNKLGSASMAKVAESEADYNKAIAEEKIADKRVADCFVKAPFSGQVTELFVHQYETLQLNQKLFTIMDNDSLVVNVLVPSQWLSWLKIGDKFQLFINENHKTYTAVVERIVNQVDAVSRSVTVIGKIQGEGSDLKSGMSGDAVFQGK